MSRVPDWDRLEDLFERAQAVDPNDRSEWLDDQCAGDPELRAELVSLLASAPGASSYLRRLSDELVGPGARGLLEDASPTIPDASDPVLMGHLLEGGSEDPHQLDRLKAALADQYAIERELGAGGMATVYLAHDVKHHRKVAVKVLRPELAAALGAGRFVDEIRTTANLQHPHILPLFDSGEVEGFLYYVMPFVEGETLRDKLVRERQFSLEESVEITKSVAAALDYAHEQGVIHRDIKPENILLQRGQALVADFGIALAVSQAGGTRLTATGLSLGTPQYMSPEQATGERDLDARTDVYALGCMLYEMLEGHPAFEGDTAQALIASKVMGDVPDVGVDTLVPATVVAVTRKALAAAPQDRYPSTADLSRALETAVTTEAIQTDIVHRRRARGLRVAGMVAGIALLASGGWWISTLPGGPRIERVALLPFENDRNDSTQAFFIEGMHDALITEMGQAGIEVIGRRSVMRYRDDDVTPVREIARELNVDAVIEGFAFRDGDSVGIRLRLVDGTTETGLWSASYGTAAREVIRLYRQVTGAIAREIQLTLSPDVAARLASAPTVDPAAYEAYLNGMYHWYRLTPRDLDLAERYFERALDIDPGYALAHKGIASLWGGRQQFGLVSPAEAGPMLSAAAQRALDADSTIAEVQFILAVQRTWTDFDWDAGDRAFRRALELNPSYAEARAFYAHLLLFLARPDEAFEQANLAVTMDPLNSLIGGLSCVTWSKVGRDEEAVERCRGVLRTDPTQPVALDGLGGALRHLQRYDEAQENEIARARAMGDDELVRVLETGYADGGFARAMALVAETMVARAETRFVPPGWIAGAFADAGDLENALDWFERGVAIRDPSIPYLAMDPVWKELESRPRFQEAMRRLGLPRSD